MKEGTLYLRKSNMRLALVSIVIEGNQALVRYGDLWNGVGFWRNSRGDGSWRTHLMGRTISRWTNPERFLQRHVEVDPNEVNEMLREKAKVEGWIASYQFVRDWADEQIANARKAG